MAEVTAPQEYEIVIQPSRGWLRIDWRELWEYRDLLVLLVQRDFILP
jgi:lipopolysaccharide transport system permease protein